MEGAVAAEFDEEAGENPPRSHSGGQAEGREDIHGQPCQEGADKIRVTPRRRAEPHLRGRAGEATPVHDLQEGDGCLSSAGAAGNRPRPRSHRTEAGPKTPVSPPPGRGGGGKDPVGPGSPAATRSGAPPGRGVSRSGQG